jgi:hypothetical protein
VVEPDGFTTRLGALAWRRQCDTETGDCKPEQHVTRLEQVRDLRGPPMIPVELVVLGRDACREYASIRSWSGVDIP